MTRAGSTVGPGKDKANNKGKYPAPRRAPGWLLFSGWYKAGLGNAIDPLMFSRSFPGSSNLFSYVTGWPALLLRAACKRELCVKMRCVPDF